jgi:hypothetical protein
MMGSVLGRNRSKRIPGHPRGCYYWRDELVESGWTQSTDSTSRLAEIAVIEKQEMALPPGVSDRLRQVISALRDGARVPM